MKKTHFFNRRWFLLPACLALGFLFLAGCGDGRPKRVAVSGRVLIDGKPLEAGFIRVVPQDGRAATGVIGPDGRFTLKTFDEDDGCMLGNHPLEVCGNKNLGETAIQWFAPKKYANIATSGLKIEVTGPRDDVEIHLSWKDSDHDKPFVEHIEPE